MGHAAVAAIDCGTNSTRLLVVGPDGTTLERLMRITRLGRGVDRTRRLDPDAMARTLGVLRDYRAVIDGHGVSSVRVTATSAARDATNRDDFFAAVETAVGVGPELLDGDEEARLSFAGAIAELDPTGGPYLVADIGGGSTELAVGPAVGAVQPEPVAVLSLDIGCVRLSERWLLDDPPSRPQLRAATSEAAGALLQAGESVPALRAAACLVGLAGTVAALAALDQKLSAYDRARLHHYALRREAVDGLLVALAAEPMSVRRRRPGMEPDRADVIVGGAVILSELLRAFDFSECLTSESDILDGIAMELRNGRG